MLISTAFDFKSFSKSLYKSIYIHRIFPVETILPLSSMKQDLNRIRDSTLTLISSDLSIDNNYDLQIKIFSDNLPYSESDIERSIEDVFFRTDITIQKTNPLINQKVISIYIVESIDCTQAYIGISNSAENLSKWNNGEIQFHENILKINRSELKLLEAIEQFKIRFAPGKSALDLGSAPGGWAKVLADQKQKVTTVDPGLLDQQLFYRDNITHYKMTAQKYLNLLKRKSLQFNILTNDMILDPRDSAHLMIEFSPHLKANGFAIMNLKLSGRSRERTADHSYRILRKAYKIIRVRQLYYNRSELTLWLKKKLAE